MKTEVAGTLPNPLYKTSLSLTPTPDNGAPDKENARSMSLLNINEKTPNKVLTNLIQQHSERIIHNDCVRFISRMQGKFNIYKSIDMIHIPHQQKE